jgi:dihydroxyacetone kinase-like protein
MNTAHDPGPLTGPFARRWIDQFVADFAAQVKVLSDLDRQAGDGDFGANLTSALAKAQGFIDRLEPEDFAGVFDAVSKGFLNTGGTSGPLFGMWFREIAKAARSAPVDVAALAAGVSQGLAVIQRLGHAVVGDNTMVDAMAPAADALQAASSSGTDLGAALDAAAAAARTGAQSTREMTASRGRASYVGEVARGVLDPGAVAVALFFAAGASVHTGTVSDTAWLTS